MERYGWSHGCYTGYLGKGSHEMEVGRRNFHRNRRQLRATLERPPEPNSSIEEVNPSRERDGGRSSDLQGEDPDSPAPVIQEDVTPISTSSLTQTPKTRPDVQDETDVPQCGSMITPFVEHQNTDLFCFCLFVCFSFHISYAKLTIPNSQTLKFQFLVREGDVA